MKTVLITGGNSGLGKKSAELFAKQSDISKVIITSRNKEKGKKALEELQSKNKHVQFEMIQFDSTNKQGIQNTLQDLDVIDIIVCNAGGMSGPTRMKISDYGATNMITANTIGHAALVEALLEKNKIRESVVFVSSEAARGVAAVGIPQPDIDLQNANHIRSVIEGNDTKTVNDPFYMYAHAKLFMSLYTSHLATKYPSIKIVSVSPGSTKGTNAPKDMPFPMNIAFGVMMNIMPLIGLGHTLEDGAQRYVDVATKAAYQSGGFYASPKDKIIGKLTDQRKHYPEIANTKNQHHVYTIIKEYI